MAKTIEEKRARGAAYMRRQRELYPEKYRQKSRDFNERHRERIKVERNAKYAENKADVRARRLGTTAAHIRAVIAYQKNLCAICDKELKPWPGKGVHVDHCHDTGKVRGVLCQSCNMKEGWVKRYGQRLSQYLARPPFSDIEDLA